MIREATKQDIPVLIEMMIGYSKESPIDLLSLEKNQDSLHVSKLLLSIISGRGFILIDEYGCLPRGMIMGIVIPNVWCPKVLELRELAWWVKPEFRNGSIGGRLWTEFNKRGEKMLQEKRVQTVFTTIMATSPLIDYTKRGFKPLEATFFRN